MVVVIGPCLSLSASGLYGKALLFYDTKFGARIRKPKSQFVPPGQSWEVNKTWFKQASNRWKLNLTQEQKWAWQVAYPGICDTARDIFMGQQIEQWNLSPLNNLTWPQVEVQSIGDFELDGMDFVAVIRAWFGDLNMIKIKSVCGNVVWVRKLDNSSVPIESDIVFAKQTFFAEIEFVAGHTNYIWGGLRYPNGRLEFKLLGSYSR